MKITHRRHKAAFTLIEMMAVVTIIVILASLVVGSYGYIMNRQATAKARVQIELLSKALEDYKSDFGTYPPTPPIDALDGVNHSSILFNALYLDSDNDTVLGSGDNDQRIYLPDLDPVTSKQGWTSGTASASTKIVDPWGNEYRYRTAIGETGTANASAINPDFDLWSTGKDGKTKTATPTDKVNNDDIKNF